jgi:curved DNA-binding protein CbpA
MSPAPELRERNHYQVLGLDPAAEPFLVEAAYRALMRRHHPDKGGETWRAQRINEAYAVLSDRAARARYDRELDAPGPRGSAAPTAEEPAEARRARAHATLVSHAYVGLAVLLLVAAGLSAGYGKVRLGKAREPSAAAPRLAWDSPPRPPAP